MSTCQYQGTRYQTYERGTDPNSDNYGSYTSTADCEDPEITSDGLMNTERNRQTTEYHRNQRDYKERMSENGYTLEYMTCEANLGFGSLGDVSECALTPAFEHTEGDGFPVGNYKYNVYGNPKAAFARIHLKEGNEESGVLKVNNPPNLFGRGGRGYDTYINNNEGYEYHGFVNEKHDEKACALGIDQFCQTKDPEFLNDTRNINQKELKGEREQFAEDSRRGGYDTDTIFPPK
jgi:hypothetical protein